MNIYCRLSTVSDAPRTILVRTTALRMDSPQDKKTVNTTNKEQGEKDDEKFVEMKIAVSYDESDMDEAMMLVGAERTTEFSEEYNAKLRRKLVSNSDPVRTRF